MHEKWEKSCKAVEQVKYENKREKKALLNPGKTISHSLDC